MLRDMGGPETGETVDPEIAADLEASPSAGLDVIPETLVRHVFVRRLYRHGPVTSSATEDGRGCCFRAKGQAASIVSVRGAPGVTSPVS
jgi:hypothetical protein